MAIVWDGKLATGANGYVAGSLLPDLVVSAVREGRSALITGPAGVGKTTVAAKACSTWSRTGFGSSGCPAGGDAPLAVFDPLFFDSAEDEAGPRSSGSVLDRIRGDKGADEVVVWVDDVHRADAASIDLMTTVARYHGVRLVMTHRTGQVPLDERVTRLVDDGFAYRFDDAGLPPGAMKLLFTGLCSPHLVGDDTMDRLVRTVAGNPLLAIELMRSLRSRGLSFAHGVVVWDGHLGELGSIADLLRRQPAALAPETLDALQFITVEGSIRRDMFEQISGAVNVSTLVRHGLVTSAQRAAGHEVVELGHPLYGEVAHEMHGPDTHTRQAERALEAIDPAAFEENAWVRMLDWTVRAGRVPSPDLLANARRAAAAQPGDLGRATVAEAVATFDEADDVRASAMIDLAEFGVVRGRFAEAADWLACADALIASLPPGEVRFGLLMRAALSASDVAMLHGDVPGVNDALRGALAEIGDVEPFATQLRLAIAGRMMFIGRTRETLAGVDPSSSRPPRWCRRRSSSRGCSAPRSQAGSSRPRPSSSSRCAPHCNP